MIRTLKRILCLLALPASIAHGNQIINGDFQTGALAPSTTAYALSGTMGPPSTWNIVSYDTIHPQWVDFYDHTYGNSDGFFMIVNGSTSGDGPTWAQTVSVTPNTQYLLSAWAATLYFQSPASLEFRVYDGASLIDSSSYISPSQTGLWDYFDTSFNSGGATSLSIQIWDTNLAFGGNDYALDDISLVPVPEPATLSLIAVGALGLLAIARFRGRG